MWAAGVKAAPLAEGMTVEKKKGGRVAVGRDLTLPNHPEVFVIGDMAYLEQDGAALPAVAPFAMQGGQYVAKAIKKREQSQTPKPFHYFDKGSMAVIGRNAAVTAAFGFGLTGFFAWLGWLGLHLFYLVGTRNRLLTMVNWGFDYLLFDRQVRLITEEKEVIQTRNAECGTRNE
jgi:NADH dehydrogenase